MRKLTLQTKAMKIIEALCVLNGESIGMTVESHERVLGKIYRMIHAVSSNKSKKGCKHPDWELEVHKVYQEMVDDNVI